jgi:hypothetical protein
MVTATKKIPTQEEFARMAEEVKAEREGTAEAIRQGIEKGAGRREISEYERKGISGLVEAFFGDHLGPFTDADFATALRLAEVTASERLLTKFLGALDIEGRVTDWSDNPNGILGRAIDQAADVIRPYLKESE